MPVREHFGGAYHRRCCSEPPPWPDIYLNLSLLAIRHMLPSRPSTQSKDVLASQGQAIKPTCAAWRRVQVLVCTLLCRSASTLLPDLLRSHGFGARLQHVLENRSIGMCMQRFVASGSA